MAVALQSNVAGTAGARSAVPPILGLPGTVENRDT